MSLLTEEFVVSLNGDCKWNEKWNPSLLNVSNKMTKKKCKIVNLF